MIEKLFKLLRNIKLRECQLAYNMALNLVRSYIRGAHIIAARKTALTDHGEARDILHKYRNTIRSCTWPPNMI